MKNTDTNLVLQKGESIKFLDYTIFNCENNDGLVLMKKGKKAKGYECHLGNYGTGTKENIDFCKRDAVLHFMLARPEEFANSLVNKLREKNSGTMHEYYLFTGACKKEKIELPAEITCGDSMNCMIYFNNKPLQNKIK